MSEQLTNQLTAKLRGIRPIMFDRYGGDNKTKLNNEDKVYKDEAGRLGIPILNLFSLLTAQNTPSVAKLFYGKQARELALGVQSFVNIESIDDDPTFAVLHDSEGKVWKAGDSRIKIAHHVARLAKGVPNPKERPFLPTGWQMTVRFEIQQNTLINEPTLRKMVQQGGILGLGTFRPIFGRYTVEWI